MENSNKKVACIAGKQVINIYEILQKIQHIINNEPSESLAKSEANFFFFLVLKHRSNVLNVWSIFVKEFLYFARNMEEMRKKWLESEARCKDMEIRFGTEKSMLQRKIQELK